MGSRMMHLVIAYRIAEELSIEVRTSFLLGGVAPDAVSPKDDSHFFIGSVTDYSRAIDFEGFLEKYNSKAEHPYVLGYYTHLIKDDLWLKGFYLPWLKNRMDAHEEILNLYHNDFRLLNGKLVEYYGIRKDLTDALKQFSTIPNLEEVKSDDVEKFVPYVLGDLDYEQEEINESLKVFTFDQIVGYIETSVAKGLLNLKKHN